MASLLKAFLLCDDAREQVGLRKYDLKGAGLGLIESTAPAQSPFQLFKHTLWVYLQMFDDKRQGTGRLALVRADTERRYFFRELTIQHLNQQWPTSVLVRLFNCEFPVRG